MSLIHPSPPAFAQTTPDLASQLAGMLQELQRTRDTVVGQIDAQIARASRLLNHLHEAAAAQPQPPAAPALNALQAPPKLTSVVLASPQQSGLDPELEQATLAELNDALSLAFKEIASRGGLLGK